MDRPAGSLSDVCRCVHGAEVPGMLGIVNITHHVLGIVHATRVSSGIARKIDYTIQLVTDLYADYALHSLFHMCLLVLG